MSFSIITLNSVVFSFLCSVCSNGSSLPLNALVCKGIPFYNTQLCLSVTKRGFLSLRPSAPHEAGLHQLWREGEGGGGRGGKRVAMMEQCYCWTESLLLQHDTHLCSAFQIHWPAPCSSVNVGGGCWAPPLPHPPPLTIDMWSTRMVGMRTSNNCQACYTNSHIGTMTLDRHDKHIVPPMSPQKHQYPFQHQYSMTFTSSIMMIVTSLYHYTDCFEYLCRFSLLQLLLQLHELPLH